MAPLISARRDAEDFARVVDGSQADVADRYADLTACVDLLRAHDIPAPRPEFVADLRIRLLAAADTLLVPAATGQRPASVITLAPTTRRHRRLGAAAAAFVIVGASAGVAAAAEGSLPGDPLYPIKRGIESAHVSLNTSDAAKGRDLIAQANTRLDEIDGLISDGDSTTRINDTLAAYEHSASSGADLLFVAYQRDGSSADLAALRGTFTEQLDALQRLASQAPPTTQPGFASATALVGDLDQQARVLCGNCGPDAGVSDLTNLSSAPALTSLLTQPASAAAAAQQLELARALAAKADQVASTTEKPSSGDPGGTSTQGGTSVPTVPASSLPAPSDSVEGAVTDVTGGVQGLINEVNTSSGGVLTPVTDTVDSVLDPVTNLLGH
jgi:hypothetical protein